MPCRYSGVEITPVGSELHVDIESAGFGAILATTMTPSTDSALATLLARMNNMTKSPLFSYSNEWNFLLQRIADIENTVPANPLPAGMVAIPAGHYRFAVGGVEIEGGDSSLYDNTNGVDVQFPFEPHPRYLR